MVRSKVPITIMTYLRATSATQQDIHPLSATDSASCTRVTVLIKLSGRQAPTAFLSSPLSIIVGIMAPNGTQAMIPWTHVGRKALFPGEQTEPAFPQARRYVAPMMLAISIPTSDPSTLFRKPYA